MKAKTTFLGSVSDVNIHMAKATTLITQTKSSQALFQPIKTISNNTKPFDSQQSSISLILSTVRPGFKLTQVDYFGGSSLPHTPECSHVLCGSTRQSLFSAAAHVLIRHT